ncbi:MAG: protein adenylyltransferase SelO family protein [Tepidisphaeraceae bacterium]
MYELFKSLDGRHPWRDASPHGYVDYHVRARDGGRVVYFNHDLSRELGLVPSNHADRMTAGLERAVLDAFSLQIINEYDLTRGKPFPPETIRPHPYMATRYLQLQHKDKRGLTSGDGRAVWNGVIKTDKLTFDVSSRGTGATRLSPGAAVAGKPVKTGDGSYGYSCGRADLDEMLGTALMSEIFYRNGFPTERTLTVIDYGDGTAVGVRTAPNLLRPAHLFRYLKQGRHAELKASMDYFIDRQVANGFWKIPSDERGRYNKSLRHIARSYAKLAAVLEEEYIFNWLCWDGDNMLASGAILDYGSIRQFAAKHDKYRYDDVERLSSCLTEQRFWARELVKAFAQAMRFIRTGRKLRLERFKNARALAEFDRAFERERDRRMLWRLGFTPAHTEKLLKTARTEISDLRRAMTFFEDAKVARGVEKLSDGITHKPVFLIRNVLRQLPEFYVKGCRCEFGALMAPEVFCKIMAASYASRRDTRMTPARAAKARHFQKCYQRLLAAAGPYDQVLRTVQRRSAVINHPHRMTGNAIVWIVEELIKLKSSVSGDDLQAAMTTFIESQVLVPGRWKPIPAGELEGDSERAKLLRAIQRALEECKETV